mmetsp:Transcript_5978/g.10243  ORF Transcript_5978/g.10243 Transcript_5978/m.10243 type:complete len:110 (+) Transcript_5978:597-926(+)
MRATNTDCNKEYRQHNAGNTCEHPLLIHFRERAEEGGSDASNANHQPCIANKIIEQQHSVRKCGPKQKYVNTCWLAMYLGLVVVAYCKDVYCSNCKQQDLNYNMNSVPG